MNHDKTPKHWPDGTPLPLFGSGLTHGDHTILHALEAGVEDPFIPQEIDGRERVSGSHEHLGRLGTQLEMAVEANQDIFGQTVTGNFVRLLGHVGMILGSWRG